MLISKIVSEFLFDCSFTQNRRFLGVCRSKVTKIATLSDSDEIWCMGVFPFSSVPISKTETICW